jgi:glycosyltransferase involved in cell wall biosynthesis
VKVLHLPTDVGGIAHGLSRAERDLGLHSDTLYRRQQFTRYPADYILTEHKFKPLVLCSTVRAVFQYARKYDVLHFNYGSTLVDYPRLGVDHWDLPLYKKQKLFVTFNGNDARLRFETLYPNKQKHPDYTNIHDPLYPDKKTESRIKNRISHLYASGASFFALNPDLMRCLPEGTVFLPYAISGFYEIETKPYTVSGDKLKIVHAPTNRVIKGTNHLIKAVESLQKKYSNRIELQLVEGMDNASAKKIYRTADVIVDQLRAGWYGSFAVEALKMGKPVIVFLNHEDISRIPEQMANDCREAFIEADCDTIAQVLEQCLQSPEILKRKADAGVEYVHKWHDPLTVARGVKKLYEEVEV